jgi:hypothetical protein
MHHAETNWNLDALHWQLIIMQMQANVQKEENWEHCLLKLPSIYIATMYFLMYVGEWMYVFLQINNT